VRTASAQDYFPSAAEGRVKLMGARETGAPTVQSERPGLAAGAFALCGVRTKFAGSKVLRTAVGEANVVAAMKSAGSTIGGEGNGGVIWPKVCWVRDSLSGMALVLELLAKVKAAFAGEPMDECDGIRIDLAEGWVHLRASNTEPIIRLISEAANDAAANALADRVAKAAGLP
jgi:phosphomannomutase